MVDIGPLLFQICQQYLCITISTKNMIDGSLRSVLAQDIRRLATGRMTNDAFDDRYYEVYERSDDRAVNEIAGYCYGLYSSDLLIPIRLRGRYALDAETKRTIARCVLFLLSGNEFGWPPSPNNLAARLIAGLSFSLGFPGGVAVTIIGLLMAAFDPEPLAFVLLVIGLPLAAVCLYLGFLRPIVSPDDWNRYTGFGDYERWPFLHRESFDLARKHNFLLGH
jgi:hypothetical protein